ncbi:MAG TPA: hypothetical protein DHV14_13290 [Micrococcales bacterium]|uniref:hypothetical protein n=1 Tax=Miniimonas arenae TaxID=676201 RepID=UPI000EBCB865|nr:hypothetical protein [Miniimonas arenae]HCX86080.1 hypothetical protein [Micrococcales bacterium]
MRVTETGAAAPLASLADGAADGVWLALPAEAQPPTQYSWWVWVLGLVLLALIAGWYWWVLRSTRPHAPGRSRRGDAYAAVRAQHLALLDEAQGRFESGESDLRALHLDLNHVIRQFATARTGIDTSSLTVAEFGRIEHGSALAVLLEDYSEPAFAAVSDAQAATAVDQAREVVRAW